MSWSQLKAFLWLRWRLSMNKGIRSSSVNVLIDTLFKVLLLSLACASLVAFFLVGRFTLAGASPAAFLMAWTATVAGFLFFWLVGLMSELRQSEMLSLDRFLHLPVSPAGAFLINYVGSSLNLSVLLFLPAMVGLALGLTVSRGIAMSALVGLVLCFFLMMTAVTYQLRSWLASMMANRRRRQTIIVVVTAAFIGAVMLPHFLMRGGGGGPGAVGQSEPLGAERAGPPAVAARMEQGRRFEARVRLINAVAPPGWLPHGAAKLLEREWLSVLVAGLGMGLIGVLSLMRSYRTTLRMYKGEFVARPGTGKPGTGKPASHGAERRLAPVRDGSRSTLTERRLPWISEHASAIGVTCFRSLSRAPETKLMLLSPLILLVVFGGMFASSSVEVSEYGRALRAMTIVIAILVLTMLHFIGNQFAYDRDAFRSFVLCPVPRRDVLLGKNLSFLPFAFAFMLLTILAYHWFNPLRLDHLVATLVQTVSIYVVYCLLGNFLSITLPIAIRPASGMPLPGQGVKLLLQTLMLVVLTVPFSLMLVPLGIEYAMQALDWHPRFPAFLVFSIVQAGLTVWLYLTLLGSQGALLQQREQRILEVVTQKAD